MYTVLIAEDELLVRIGIAGSVPWAEMNLRLIGEAEDGESAWALYEKFRPDIVITDIRMPGLDGMELLRRIRGGDRECAVIIITNVEHDETLREAQTLGITDVLLKASMKQDYIRLALEKACRSLPQAKGKEAVRDESALWRAALLEGEKPAGIFESRGLVMLHIFPGDKVSHRLKNSLIDLMAHELGGEMENCAVRTDTGALFVFRKSVDAGEQAMKLTELQRYVRDYFQVRIGFARITEPCGASRLRQLYQAMRGLTAWEAFFENGVLTLDLSGAYIDPDLLSLQSRMNSFSCLGGKVPQLTDFLAALRQYPGNLSGGWDLVFSRGKAVLKVLQVHEQPGSLSALTNQICESGNAFAARIEHALKPEIMTVITYIDGHLKEELSASQVSALIGYQPKYFSRLFKNEMGCNYSDYVSSRRIGRARELLLETALPVQQIAEMCGFSEVSYFSSRFKQETGMTPKQMRAAL